MPKSIVKAIQDKKMAKLGVRARARGKYFQLDVVRVHVVWRGNHFGADTVFSYDASRPLEVLMHITTSPEVITELGRAANVFPIRLDTLGHFFVDPTKNSHYTTSPINIALMKSDRGRVEISVVEPRKEPIVTVYGIPLDLLKKFYEQIKAV